MCVGVIFCYIENGFEGFLVDKKVIVVVVFGGV